MKLNEPKLLRGKPVADFLLEKLKQEIAAVAVPRAPCVAFIRVGDDGASVSYVKQKEKTAQSLGIKSLLYVFDSQQTREAGVLQKIQALNADKNVDGILVQAPLPQGMDFTKICNTICPQKDVDGFGAENLGQLMQETSGMVPCTPAGIIEILKYYQISPAGKHVVIVNRSLIVGKPLAMLLSQRSKWGNATVTIAHSQSENLAQITRNADILVTACGKPAYFKENFVKSGAVVIDVGITRVSDNSDKGYHLQGDVDFDSVAPKVQAITPVPGGVGPLTVAQLMRNTFRAFQHSL